MKEGTAKKYQPREIMGEPSTDRTKALRQSYLDDTRRLDVERLLLLTEAYRKLEGKPIMIKKARAYRYVMENLTPVIHEGELIVAAPTRFLRGSSLDPEKGYQWIKNGLRGLKTEEDKFAQLAERFEKEADFISFKIDASGRAKLEEVIDYWKGKSLACIAGEIFGNSPEWNQWIEAGNCGAILGPMSYLPFIEGRMVLDYDMVLQEGLNGIIASCEERIKNAKPVAGQDANKIIFWKGVIGCCKGVIRWAENYAVEAERLAREEADPDRKRELEKIAATCRRVPADPAGSFYEALQSFWFTHVAAFVEHTPYGFSPGRFDQYIYPFYKEDQEKGNITRKEAIELLECLWVKFLQVDRSVSMHGEAFASGGSGNMYQHMILGGLTEDGKGADNELSSLILESKISMQTAQPTLGIRFNERLSEEFLLKAIEVVKTGAGMPAWFNDNVAIPHFLRYSQASLEDARDWSMGGCVEMQMPKRAPGLNMPPFTNEGKILELALNDGIDPLTGKRLAPSNGVIENYDDLKKFYLKTREYIIKLDIDNWNRCMMLHADTIPLVFNSALINDCIETGKSIDEGGARYYNTQTFITVGTVNVANSLASIKKNVFEDKVFTLSKLKEALAANYEGYEFIHKKCRETPKFGNDDDYVDSILVELYQHFADFCLSRKTYYGHPHIPVALSISTHPVFGAACGALPDGRKAGVALCDAGISAFPGTDVKGATALIRSGVKVDALPFGAVQLNMKFHPTALRGTEGSKNLLSLIKTYFDLGGWHVQFNIVDSEMLRDAQKHPEQYRDLMIRVAGFSAYWVELSKQVQDEVIIRTEFGEI